MSGANDRPTWHDKAACKGLAHLFEMPEWIVKRRQRQISRSARTRIEQAKTICAACPVRHECDTHYRQHPDNWMITAGKTPQERRSEPYSGKFNHHAPYASLVLDIDELVSGKRFEVAS